MTILDLVMKEMNFELLRASCSRLIFCHCGAVLDVRRAVLAYIDYDRETVAMHCMCGDCWDNGNGARFQGAYENWKDHPTNGSEAEKLSRFSFDGGAIQDTRMRVCLTILLTFNRS